MAVRRVDEVDRTPVRSRVFFGFLSDLAGRRHQRLKLATDIEIYFCDPRSPWQGGSNENTTRLLRQYLPRGTDLALHSQAKLNAIARQLNERPRKTLLYQTPAEKFAECVAAIG
jgi:IS30 family transposase